MLTIVAVESLALCLPADSKRPLLYSILCTVLQYSYVLVYISSIDRNSFVHE